MLRPDPLGRRGESDLMKFARYYGSPVSEFYDTSIESMLRKSSVIYGSMFSFGYFEAYLTGASVMQRWSAGMAAVNRYSGAKLATSSSVTPVVLGLYAHKELGETVTGNIGMEPIPGSGGGYSNPMGGSDEHYYPFKSFFDWIF